MDMNNRSSFKSSGWIRALGYLCLGLIFFFLFRELWSNWSALKAYAWKLDFPLGALSFVVLTGSLFLLPWGLAEVLALLGHRLPYRRMCRILFTSLMGKYLPGGWWAFVGRAHLYCLEGVSLSRASVAVFMETILIVTSGIVVFSIFSQTHSTVLWEGWRIPLIFLGIACLALVHPFFLNLLLSLTGRIFRKSVVPQSYPYIRIIFPFFVFLLFWLGMGVSFWLLACSLADIKLTLLPHMVSAFSLSWVLGFLSFLTPGGLGVREGALTLLLKPFFPLFVAAALSLFSRVWWIAGEVLALIISILWERMAGCIPGIDLLPMPGVKRDMEE